MNTSSDLSAALSYHSPLGCWYATPMSRDAARQCLEQYDKRRQRRLRHGRGDAITLRLASAMTRFQLGENIESEIAAMEGQFRRRHSPRALAFLFLIQGQLLAAQQMPGATEKLTQGFRLANHLLHPQDYFSLLHRHNLLALLPSTSQQNPQMLKALLQTAAVQERMQNKHRGFAQNLAGVSS